jgi:radical SAM protein with 4Fe4S-binding SPASM domain
MNSSPPVCRKPWENFLVEVNGDCYFCCFIIRPGGKIGNLTRKSFEDIWNGRKARRIRKAVAGGAIPYYCQACPYYGRFKHDKSQIYRTYFFGRKALDAVIDIVQGGFTRRRMRLALKRTFRRS